MDKSQGRRQRRIPPESAPLPNSCDNSTSQFSCSAKTCEPSLISSEWPPPGLTWSMDLKQQEAEDLICHGATTFHGYYEKTQLGHRRCYAIMRTEPGTSTNQTRSPDPFTQTMSATLTGVPDPQRPWEALEHPSLMSCFGDGPGTITLNYWLGISGGPRPVVKHKPNVISRKVGLLWLLERIRSLEFGLEADVSSNSFVGYKPHV